MSIFVDGYNYIGHSEELQLNDPTARDKLIYLMGLYCASARKSLTLVFDGNYFVQLANRKRRYGRVTVIYTSPIYTADDAIKKIVKNQQARSRKSMLIVSSDQEILQYAESHGTKTAKSQEFELRVYQALSQKKGVDRVNIRLSAEEVKEWLEIFGPEPPETSPETSRTQRAPGVPVAKERKKLKTTQKTTQKKRKKSVSRPSLSVPDSDGNGRINAHLSKREVDEWMLIFGETPDDDMS